MDGILKALQEIDTDFETQSYEFYEFYDGLIEAAYKLTVHGHYQKAHELLEKVYRFSEQTGTTLLEARTYIILSALVYYQHLEAPDNTELVQKGLVLCEKAIFILAEDIFHDTFFLEQAQNNYAILLRMAGRYDDAIKIYENILSFDVPRNLNSQIHLLYNLSICHYYMQEYQRASVLIDKALSLNIAHERQILLGHLYTQATSRCLLQSYHSAFMTRHTCEGMWLPFE